MYKKNKMLKEVAEKRLHAIREFTDLGSGFKDVYKRQSPNIAPTFVPPI